MALKISTHRLIVIKLAARVKGARLVGPKTMIPDKLFGKIVNEHQINTSYLIYIDARFFCRWPVFVETNIISVSAWVCFQSHSISHRRVQ